MSDQSFKTSFTVAGSPQEVFAAINNPRGWWSEEITGETSHLNDEFRYHFKDVHSCRMKLVEMTPQKNVVWLVLENHFSFAKDQREWVGTKVIFDISREGEKTTVQFTHEGLVPAHECFTICRDAWTGYITGSLSDLITTGKGAPNPREI